MGMLSFLKKIHQIWPNWIVPMTFCYKEVCVCKKCGIPTDMHQSLVMKRNQILKKIVSRHTHGRSREAMRQQASFDQYRSEITNASATIKKSTAIRFHCWSNMPPCSNWWFEQLLSCMCSWGVSYMQGSICHSTLQRALHWEDQAHPQSACPYMHLAWWQKNWQGKSTTGTFDLTVCNCG